MTYRIVRPLLLAAAMAVSLVSMPTLQMAGAGQDDARLDGLFAKLRDARSPIDARVTERLIWRIWIEHPDPEIARLMGEGMAAMAQDRDDAALAAFDEVVKRDARFAEGWNKRATVEFEMGDFQASVTDIERTLALEPRHFGALSGLGQIYLELDDKQAALKAFSGALAIDPQLEGVKDMVNRIKSALAGDPI